MRLCVLTALFISLLCLASPLSAAISEKAWVDLPEARLLTSFIKENGEQRDLLNSKISAYHAIAKTKVEALPDRINALDNILAELARLSPKEASHHKAKHLVRLVEKKRWYLNELRRIYKEDTTSYAVLQQHHTNISKFQLGSLRPLFLANKLMFDAKLPGHWGLYWMETVDPSHRQLMPYYMAWSSIPSPKDPFFMWLETQIVPFYVPHLVFLTETELDQAQPHVIDGLLYTPQGEPANYDDDDEYIFVVTLEKRIIIAKATATVHHVSLSHGRPLLASGALKARNGTLTYIDAESGHYLPSMAHLSQAIALFRESGLKFDFSCQVRYYDSEGVSHTVTIEQFEKLPLEPPAESLPFYNEQDFNKHSRLKD